VRSIAKRLLLRINCSSAREMRVTGVTLITGRGCSGHVVEHGRAMRPTEVCDGDPLSNQVVGSWEPVLAERCSNIAVACLIKRNSLVGDRERE